MPDEDRKHWWDSLYSRRTQEDAPNTAAPAEWILAELTALSGVRNILDLGCGFGHAAERLHSAGYTVLATDISPVALRQLRHRAPGIGTLELDHARPLPFGSHSFDAVVADLSLHYFNAAVTEAIVAEIARVLRPQGVLIARANSINDTNYGAGLGREVEPGFFERDGHYKRFFDEPSLRRFLSGWHDVRIRHVSLDRIGPVKHVLQVFARRPA